LTYDISQPPAQRLRQHTPIFSAHEHRILISKTHHTLVYTIPHNRHTHGLPQLKQTRWVCTSPEYCALDQITDPFSTANQQPITTIPPFSDTAKLPSCAVACQPLWDANGKCVPPAVSTADASVYMDCFCKDSRVTGFSTATTGVCDNACDANGLGSIVTWFRGTCSAYGGGSQTTTTAGGNSGGSSGSKNRGGGGDW
jgi:hypothetical protein